MANPALIPIPPGQRWRDFRTQVVPGLVFVLVLLAAVVIWKRSVFSGSLVGRVESVQADVASPKAGWLTQLRVGRFDRVRAGELVAEVAINPPNVVTASLAVIRAEIDQIRVGMGPIWGPQRNAYDFDQLRLNSLRQQVDLATAQVNLQLATSEFQRYERLFRDRLVSELEIDIARAKRDALSTEVAEKAKLLAEAKRALDRMGPTTTNTAPAESQLQSAIAVQRERLRLTEEQMRPLVLRAPVDGTVNLIHRWNGETVKAGDPILTIGSTRCERIIGYLRQPFYITPRTNMTVQVRTRGARRETGLGKILALGGQLQSINDGLLPPTKYNIDEMGLPILVSLPDNLRSRPGQETKVRPGELVDLYLLP